MKKLLFIFVIIACSNFSQTLSSAKLDHSLIDVILDNVLYKESPKSLFKIFHYLYQKQYDLNSEESLTKYRNFKKNIKSLKSLKENTQITYKVGINEHFDEEFIDNEVQPEFQSSISSIQKKSEKVTVFPSIDWRSKLSPPLSANSGCSSHSHLAYAAALDFMNGFTTSTTQISPQSLIDCLDATKQCKRECFYSGNFLIPGIKFFSMSDYPYTGIVGNCKQDSTVSNVKVKMPYMWEYQLSSSSKGINADLETILTILNDGPILAYTGFWPSSLYKGGIYTPSSCSTTCSSYYTQLIVGTGSENGVDYWIVRGNFGTSWGEKGYMRIARNDAVGNYAIYCDYSRPLASR